MKKLFMLTAVLLTSVCTQAQQLPLVYETENTGINANPVLPTKEQGTKVEALPDPLAWSDGSGRVKDFKDWSPAPRQREKSGMLRIPPLANRQSSRPPRSPPRCSEEVRLVPL